MSVPAQCEVGQDLINGVCFASCPANYVSAPAIAPNACVLDESCPLGFNSLGFTICQKPTETRTITASISGDCPNGYTFWNGSCTSECSSSMYTIVDGSTCAMVCPAGYEENVLNCYKPVVFREPVLALCPLQQVSLSNGECGNLVPQYNQKLFTYIAIVAISIFLLYILLTRNISVSFSSASKKDSSEIDYIPGRADPLNYLRPISPTGSLTSLRSY